MSQPRSFNADIFPTGVALRAALTLLFLCLAIAGTASGGTGSYETASGYRAVEQGTGIENSGFGYEALYRTTTGQANTAADAWALTETLPTATTSPLELKRCISTPPARRTPPSEFALSTRVEPRDRKSFPNLSARFKQKIKPMTDASEALLALQPVTFRYNDDPDNVPQFGLIAEEVEKVNPDLVVRDVDGKINTVRYEAVNAMLLNEFLKQHRKVQEQENRASRQDATIVQLEATVARQREQMKELAADVKQQASAMRNISAQLELNNSRPQVVIYNP